MKKVAVLLLLALVLLVGCMRTFPDGLDSSGSHSSAGTNPSTTPSSSSTESSPPEDVNDIKAIWLSQYDMFPIYTDGNTQRNQDGYSDLIDTVLNNLLSYGFNTVFLQIRPNGDSMYPSDLFPMSRYAVAAYGKEASYDPVEILVKAAHKKGLQIHAWINPLRLMTSSEITQVSNRYLIRQWHDDPARNGTYIVEYNNRYYLNPAYPEVRQLILDGASEIFRKYAFDGLHMDDYFYPSEDAAFDSAAYSAYIQSGGSLSLADYRRSNMNQVVKALYDVTKSAAGNAVFGISPAGNIDNVYNKQFADVYTWCSESGYIDYICPQVYFGLEHGSHDFKSVCQTWSGIIKNPAIDMLVGMTLEKTISEYDAYAKTEAGKYEWRNHKDIIARCLRHTQTLPLCRGVSLFSYYLMFDPLAGSVNPETEEEVSNFLPVFKNMTWNQMEA